MYCRNCGQEIPDDVNFCPNCGVPVKETGEPVNVEGLQRDHEYRNPDQNWYQAPDQQEYGQPGMKWYRFIIYVQLFLMTFSNLTSAFMAIAGKSYDYAGGSSAAVYTQFPAMRAVDMTYGFVMLVIAFSAVYVRNQLAGFRSGAPNKYLLLFAVNFAAGVIYLFVASKVTGTVLVDVNEIFSSVGSILMLIINGIYFRKREHLFIN